MGNNLDNLRALAQTATHPDRIRRISAQKSLGKEGAAVLALLDELDLERKEHQGTLSLVDNCDTAFERIMDERDQLRADQEQFRENTWAEFASKYAKEHDKVYAENVRLSERISELEAKLAGDKILRTLLFLRHGCSHSALYGDDGEMQCSACLIDFKRQSPEEIHDRFRWIGEALLAAEHENNLPESGNPSPGGDES